MNVSQLLKRFRDRDVQVGVIGLGYVGLPLALAITNSGAHALGFDVDPMKPKMLTHGDSYIKHIRSEDVQRAISTGRFAATSDFSRLKDVDAILICVPTPLEAHREPDLSYVVSTGEVIA